MQRGRLDDTVVVMDEERAILKHATAVIEGRVDEKGKAFWSLTSSRLDLSLDEERLPDEGGAPIRYRELKHVRLKAFYFIYSKELLPPGALRRIRSVASRRGGIRVYRNGFRVPPYGDRDANWLGIDELARSRSFLPPFGNNNFFGFVEISDIEGRRFEETSNREGLVETEALSNCSNSRHAVLRASATRIPQNVEPRSELEIATRHRSPASAGWPVQCGRHSKPVLAELMAGLHQLQELY